MNIPGPETLDCPCTSLSRAAGVHDFKFSFGLNLRALEEAPSSCKVL